MTATEKAEELKYKYMSVRLDICQDDAKQCALIAVDEILDNGFHFIDDSKFWEEVKQELLKI